MRGASVLPIPRFSWPGGRDAAVSALGGRADAAVRAVLGGEVPPWADFALASRDAEKLDAVPRGPTLVLGMGGSALGTRCVESVIQAQGHRAHPIRVLDTVDPITAKESFEWAQERHATLMVVSKSGKTVEISALLDAWLRVAAALPASDGDTAQAGGTIVVVSDPEPTPLDAALARAGVRVLRLSMPASVGGRYSMFTSVVQAPLAAAGLDPLVLCRAAEQSWRALTGSPVGARDGGTSEDEGAHARASLVEAMIWRARHPAPYSVMWSYADTWLPLAAWIQQLDCESLGRTRAGRDPVGDMVTPLRGPADQHSVAQLLLEGPKHARVSFLDRGSLPADADLPGLSSLRHIELRATADALAAQGVPTAELVIDASLEGLARACLRSMIETVAWAQLDEIDPYGQPAVELIKARIRAAGIR